MDMMIKIHFFTVNLLYTVSLVSGSMKVLCTFQGIALYHDLETLQQQKPDPHVRGITVYLKAHFCSEALLGPAL